MKLTHCIQINNYSEKKIKNNDFLSKKIYLNHLN